MSCAKSQPAGMPFERANLIDVICRSLAILWKEWPHTMKFVKFWDGSSFSLSGKCPHCNHDAAFMSVTDSFREEEGELPSRMIAVARCLSCTNYILAILKAVRIDRSSFRYEYERHYPLGTPDDTLPEDIPTESRSDFKEAIRAEWITAYKATVLMCRRSLQTSCDMEKAAGNDLYTQIEDLAAKQKITQALKDMAHRIRLLGKKGAHGDYSDIDDSITPEDASDAITFMRHYFEHVYVLPAKLAIPLKGTGKKRP